MYSISDFVWDKKKERSNYAKHKIQFEDAMHIFNGLVLTLPDKRHDYGEMRHISIGNAGGQTILTVVHTDRLGKIRIISARKAKRKERKMYEAFVKETSEGNSFH